MVPALTVHRCRLLCMEGTDPHLFHRPCSALAMMLGSAVTTAHWTGCVLACALHLGGSVLTPLEWFGEAQPCAKAMQYSPHEFLNY